MPIGLATFVQAIFFIIIIIIIICGTVVRAVEQS